MKEIIERLLCFLQWYSVRDDNALSIDKVYKTLNCITLRGNRASEDDKK